jgi:hypothetical protein
MGLLPSDPLMRSLTTKKGEAPYLIVPAKPTSVGKEPLVRGEEEGVPEEVDVDEAALVLLLPLVELSCRG